MSKINFSEQYFMRQALNEAQKAMENNEIPVGAVVVTKNIIIARTHNLTETLRDVTAHAEILAITAATEHLGGKYLTNCTLYVTLEPCVMCAGALNWAQLGRLVIGAPDDKRGYKRMTPNPLHPKTEVTEGIMSQECGKLIKSFFSPKR